MNKDWFEKETKKIDVPKDEVHAAISKGIGDGKKEKRLHKRKKSIKASAILSSTAASIVLASGFLFAPVTEVLAKVPFLSAVYEHAPSVGNELFNSNLVTELNQKASDNGVDVTITSAYYDGNIIGVTFEAQGDQLTTEHMDEGNRPVGGLAYETFDGKELNQWGSGSSGLQKDGDHFVGSIEFYNPEERIADNFTLPLTFTHLGDVNGKWRFDIPVERIPTEEIQVNKSIRSEDGVFQLHVESIIKGKATTMIEYTYTVPEKEDTLNVSVFDNNEKRLGKSHADVLRVEEKDVFVQKTVRELFPNKIDENADSLIIYAETELYDQEVHQTLDMNAPIKIKSNRFDYQITVENFKQENGEVTIDFKIDNLENGQIRDDLLLNFAEFVQLIPTEQVLKNKDGKLDIEKMLKYEIRSYNIKVRNKDDMRYQSTFHIGENTDIREYSLLVPFPTLSLNDKPVTLDPLKIDLK
ncbi:DUF4179 domain-containing protein [Bacillus sp. Marseille-Q3570]|uniref:DUF4179 domain-containing protein n=1 Tax=Bacillus sp. Marseille-Q3570 TaxID=2963522 RepID=UPI0021B842DC|nr:DUF4179 domain-containing protein [Bacillus sp. Marseille-Q3570]